MTKKEVYTQATALRDIIMWVGDSVTPETAAHIKEVLGRLASQCWCDGYDDCTRDYEENS